MIKGQGHWDGILLFESTVISQKLSHRKISIFFIDTSLDTLFDEIIKTRACREMTSQKIRQYLTLTCKTPIPKLLIIIKSSIKILKIWQSYSPVLLIFSISVPNLVTIGRHLTSFLTCATFNM